jgi:hypothetical protein
VCYRRAADSILNPAARSGAVFSVIVTVMVLELNAPNEPIF